jgi:hypothetical protein
MSPAPDIFQQICGRIQHPAVDLQVRDMAIFAKLIQVFASLT